MIAWGVVAVVIGGALLLALVISVISLQRKSDRNDRLSELRELGFLVLKKPPKEARPKLFVPFESVPGLGTGAKGLRLHAQGDMDGRAVTLIQHLYMTTMVGQTPFPVHHSVAAAPCPAGWPPVHLEHRPVVLGFLSGKSVKLDRESFNRRWRVKADDEGFAIMLLTPELQKWLEDAPRKESWLIEGGWVRCVWSGEARGPDLKLLARRPAKLLALAPTELDTYPA